MWQRNQAVSIFARNGRFKNRISNLARVNLTHMLGVLSSHSQSTVGFSFWFIDQCHSPRLQGTNHIPAPVVLQHKFNFLSLRESGEYVHLPGRSVTRLTTYHIHGMWLLLSNA